MNKISYICHIRCNPRLEHERCIAFYCLSTQKQGISGLGLEAQKAACLSLTAGAPVLAQYLEAESGKKDNGPRLTAAIAHAKQTGTTLVIAKLDSLSRNAGFIFALKGSGVDFICADMPNTLKIGISAVTAQHERELISKRTKDALAAKKALQDKANKDVQHWALELRKQGFKLQETADKLNEMEQTTSIGARCRAMSVKRLLDRHGKLQQELITETILDNQL